MTVRVMCQLMLLPSPTNSRERRYMFSLRVSIYLEVLVLYII
jgi:hypothetical protein